MANLPAPKRRATTYGTCTHITMGLLYEDISCDLCHRFSHLGFLYQCKQDMYIDKAMKNYQNEFPDPRVAAAQAVSPTEQLRAINMSASIISQYKKGDIYTQNQIDLLKLQKAHMLSTLEYHRSRLPPVLPKCELKCCPACRPYLKDRVPYSFDAVFAGEIDPVRPDMERLPIKNATAMLELGLRTPAVYIEASDTDDEGEDDISLSSAEEEGYYEEGYYEEGYYEGGATEEEEKAANDIGNDGAAITEESVETAVPDIILS